MNYMSNLANIFNLELNEDFCIEGSNFIFHFDKKGLYDEAGAPHNEKLLGLLTGVYKIRPIKPQKGQYYWYISCKGEINQTDWSDFTSDYMRYAVGNCYRSRFRAEQDIEKWKGFYNNIEDMRETIEGALK